MVTPSDLQGLLTSSASALVDDDGEVGVARLAVEGAAWAEAWQRAGLRPGDRVGFRLPNSRGYVRGLAACAAGGFVAVSVNTRWSLAEGERLLRRSGAAALLTDLDALAPDLARVPAWDGTSSGAGPRQASPRRADDPFVVFTTSGTTSEPKMVLHRQRSIVEHAPDAASAFGYRPGDPIAVVMPLCGVFGLTSFAAAVAADARVYLPSVIDPLALAGLVETEGIVALNGSDDLFHRMLATDHDLSTLRLGGYGRFNTSLDGIAERAEARGASLVGLYGMSEVQALFAVRPPDGELPERARAGGRLASDRAAVRVVDGELQLRGPSLFAGYLAEGGADVDRDRTDAAHDDGWFRTGDAGTVDQTPADDPRPRFTFEARLGDVLRLGGFLVAPSEIETVLLELPGVDEAQVVAVDRPSGARPVAFVIGDPPAEEDVIAHCHDRLARYKCPVRVVTVDAFPTTPSANGTKIQRAKLRERAERELAS